jgi:hypothetical protein
MILYVITALICINSISKGIPYYPRIGHCGYRSNKPNKDEENREKLATYLLTSESKQIIDSYHKYMIK